MNNFLQQEYKDEYLPFGEFLKEKNTFSYAELDQCTLQNLNLFILPNDEYFLSLLASLNKIIQSLPALKRIFTKPITRLQDVNNILPTESVRVINNQSVVHASLHSQLWGDITEEGLKPRKLLTIDRQEDYEIYENVAFVRLVRLLLDFVNKNTAHLKDVMYACRDLQVNLLDRTNHLNYFLAIGKLHISYARAQNEYAALYEQCLEKLFFISKTLHSKLNTPIYRICKKNKSKLTLKKTNIFRLHKDYRQVYALLKWFHKDKEEILFSPEYDDFDCLPYANYCSLLTVFAAGHFNFQFSSTKKLNFLKLNANAEYSGWKLNIKSLEKDGIYGLLLSVNKETTYRICLLFCRNEPLSAKQIQTFQKEYEAEEYRIASPLEQLDTNNVYISLFDIDSFRRIQQLLLRAMIYADTSHTLCPFCGHSLKQEDAVYSCPVCQTKISQWICDETNQPYYTTSIAKSSFLKRQKGELDKNKFLFHKYAESQMHYRNITNLTANGTPICPKCGKTHT